MLIGLADIIRAGYYDSEMAIRYAIQKRRLPKPRRISHKLKWEERVIREWFENRSVVWIPRSKGRS